ncbi:MAG: ATP-dependent DNA helicase RecG [Flammeovirgaceae bacterium]|jgi:ATP-dependent DNA helicase RecG|nr:ATP-dependent DNA helicase RecG [Flammeovirgaceae bacterium]|tara:strand:- start:8100 stop:10193 length:2094 start_codon:yes stop_codon:yes gene_type:complete
MAGVFHKPIEFLKGIGPEKAVLLNKELGIFTYADLIQHFPFRYEDRTTFHKIAMLSADLTTVQVIGKIVNFENIGTGHNSRLVAKFQDTTGEIDLIWFQGAKWVQRRLRLGIDYVVFGKPVRYGQKYNISHPEVEVYGANSEKSSFLQPVYHTSEKLKKRFIDSRALSKAMKMLLAESIAHIQDKLPQSVIEKYVLMDKKAALINIHFPKNHQALKKAQFRLKFEELFFVQLRLITLKLARIDKFKGILFKNSKLLNDFYANYLPFDLTRAQKKVIKEIYADFRSGKQMNRLVQGDVGSGKTIVAFMCMLIAIGNDSQCALMAPTEILATQHFNSLAEFADPLGIKMACLTGSTKKAVRKVIHEDLAAGTLKILIGTHALIEDNVKFKNLALAVIDEQHRFGVAQRAKLWNKNKGTYPHILVMTATPIPRTLAMTLYGDLDISTIDELPAGRKPILTMHMRDAQRIRLFSMLEKEIQKGRQVYVVYPLIEESATMDYKDLMDGYQSMVRRFPHLHLSICHGKMKSEDKDFEMKRFAKGETQIMIATTVIEVGVNVPNASVMVIESAERFGLSQLHQLRGRVGRGAEQSYCVLMSGHKLTKEAKTRIEIMVETNDGFRIAETDLKLRGPGDLMGTQQSGALDLMIADLATDGALLVLARNAAVDLLNMDTNLTAIENQSLKNHINSFTKNIVNWSRIS